MNRKIVVACVGLLAIFAVFPGCESKGTSPTNAVPSGIVTPAPVTEKARTPIVLAHLKGDPSDIAVDTNAVYVTEQDWEKDDLPTKIVRIPLDGSNSTVLAAKQRNGQSIVPTKDALFWIAGGDTDKNIPDAVMRLPLAGGKPTTVGKTFVFSEAALVADATYLYFGDYREKTARLMKLPIAGGNAQEVSAYGNDSISVLAVDATSAYWVSLGAIVKAPLGGGPVTVLVKDTGVGNVWGLASDGNHLYWTDRNNYKNDDANTGAVRRIPVAGGTVETIASGLRGRPWGIATDATHIYWVINAERGGGIMRAPKAGGPASVVVGGQSAPTNLALDGTYVYWANASGDRAVGKATKAP